jgi:hypothetical protein
MFRWSGLGEAWLRWFAGPALQERSRRLGKFPNPAQTPPQLIRRSSEKTRDFRRSSSLARAMQSVRHRAERTARTQPDLIKHGETTMTATASNLFAAAFAIVISASLFAYAIVPASPTVFA